MLDHVVRCVQKSESNQVWFFFFFFFCHNENVFFSAHFSCISADVEGTWEYILGKRGQTHHSHYGASLCSYSTDIPTGLVAPTLIQHGCRAVESTRELCPAFCQHASTDTKSSDGSQEWQLPRTLSKLRSNCLNLAVLITHKARICHYTAYSSPNML